ncbi:multidrug transporter [Pediococcus ethanolidurans]|uniref:PTS sugar transporter subunit IIA domain-containing protein n=1 Tax=Pediococcus ethanolidurans TaxID=319653 RepID=UPI001C1F0038|nr:multidrug transporter [Pediococcus ethanolidurans]MBU7555169.1 multidrug transporter [Pediococcus ethanolidurans]MCV3328168.1 multidrug transporter [Pediococcus ethanolidurans]
MQIIVTGHGNFASGIESTIKLLAKSIANVHYVDFTGEMDETSLAKEYQSLLSSDEKTLFFCDLVGGTPYKQAVVASSGHEEQIAVVAGCNVGSLLELGLNSSVLDDKSIADVAKLFVETSKKNTKTFTHQVQQEQIPDDGI